MSTLVTVFVTLFGLVLFDFMVGTLITITPEILECVEKLNDFFRRRKGEKQQDDAGSEAAGKLIDAEKLIEELQRSHDFLVDAYGGFKNMPPKEKAVVDQIITDISRIVNAPAVDTVPARRGVWRDKKITLKKAHGLAYGRWSCSACKAKQPHRSNFCPNCGADMRREGDEER